MGLFSGLAQLQGGLAGGGGLNASGACTEHLTFILTTRVQDFPVAQMVKNLPTMPETRVQSLGWEVPLEKGMAIHFSILAWRIPWTEKPGGLQSMESQRARND